MNFKVLEATLGKAIEGEDGEAELEQVIESAEDLLLAGHIAHFLLYLDVAKRVAVEEGVVNLLGWDSAVIQIYKSLLDS